MKRREFITLLGGAAAAWPLAAGAQQERMRRIGILMNATAEEPEAQTYVAAFQQGLQEFGWSVGRNLRIDLRWGGGDADRTRRYAAERRPVERVWSYCLVSGDHRYCRPQTGRAAVIQRFSISSLRRSTSGSASKRPSFSTLPARLPACLRRSSTTASRSISPSGTPMPMK